MSSIWVLYEFYMRSVLFETDIYFDLTSSLFNVIFLSKLSYRTGIYMNLIPKKSDQN